MPLQWRNEIWQSLEEGAGKRCSECAQGLDTQSALSDEVWERGVVAGREENAVGGRDMLLKPGSNPQPLDSERSVQVALQESWSTGANLTLIRSVEVELDHLSYH